MTDLQASILEGWDVQQRINLRLLDLVGEDHLRDTYASRVREIGKVFAHIHNTRIMWLDAARALPEGVKKIDKDVLPRVDAIRDALVASGDAVRDFLAKCIEKGKVPGFKRSPATFFAYLVAHEAHHRGQVIVALRLSGHPLAQEDIYGLWDWDKH